MKLTLENPRYATQESLRSCGHRWFEIFRRSVLPSLAFPLPGGREIGPAPGRAPAGTGHWLAALDFYVSAPKEVVIIGPRSDPATAALLRTVNGGFRPNKVLVGVEDSEAAGGHGLPLLESRGMVDGKPTAYVCQNYACQLPVTTPEELAAQLEG